MNILMQSVKSFQNLLQYEYQIIAGSKNRLIHISLAFSTENFAHLIGIHKLKDLNIQRNSYRKLFDMISSGKLKDVDIQKSIYYEDIKERLELFPILEQVLDSNDILIKFRKGFAKGTIIDADYLIIYPYIDTLIHYFVAKDEFTGKYIGKSFFCRNDNKYLLKQQTFKVLKKIKICKKDNTCIVLYDKLTKKEEG